MLGKLLGFGVTAPERAASFNFYGSLGFAPVPVGDGGAGPYAALSDGAVAIGLHDSPEGGTSGAALFPIFVRPELRAYVRAYRRLGIDLELERLASDEFNEVAFSDPSGQIVRVLEARTFAPAAPAGRNVCACGTFLELSVAARSTGHSQTFWEALGLKAADAGSEPHRWTRLEGHGLTIGLHEGTPFASGLTFRATHLAARVEYLKAKGFDVRGGPFAAHGRDCAMLLAPEGTPLYLLDA